MYCIVLWCDEDIQWMCILHSFYHTQWFCVLAPVHTSFNTFPQSLILHSTYTYAQRAHTHTHIYFDVRTCMWCGHHNQHQHHPLFQCTLSLSLVRLLALSRSIHSFTQYAALTLVWRNLFGSLNFNASSTILWHTHLHTYSYRYAYTTFYTCTQRNNNNNNNYYIAAFSCRERRKTQKQKRKKKKKNVWENVRNFRFTKKKSLKFQL